MKPKSKNKSSVKAFYFSTAKRRDESLYKQLKKISPKSTPQNIDKLRKAIQEFVNNCRGLKTKMDSATTKRKSSNHIHKIVTIELMYNYWIDIGKDLREISMKPTEQKQNEKQSSPKKTRVFFWRKRDISEKETQVSIDKFNIQKSNSSATKIHRIRIRDFSNDDSSTFSI